MKTKFYISWSTLLLCLLFLNPFQVKSQFTPGEGGSITFTPFVAEPGKFGGLLVTKSDRQYESFLGYTRSSIDLSFPDAATLQCDLLTLQFLDTDTQWKNLMISDQPVTTTGDNFRIRLATATTLRLKATGGVIDGHVSNTVVATPSTIDTRFASWGLDESMWISGVMVPWVGRGLEARVNIVTTPGGVAVENAVSYQWYRVNPVTYEMTAIQGADSNTYITTSDDLGYRLMYSAQTDGVNAGGYINYMSNWDIVEPNFAFADEISTTGFRLNLFKKIDEIPLSELILRDNEWNEVPVDAITKIGDGAQYQITADMNKEASPYMMENQSPFWKIAQKMGTDDDEGGGHGHHMMEFVLIDLSTLDVNEMSQENLIYPVPARNIIHFSTREPIFKAEIFDLQGRKLIATSDITTRGSLNISTLKDGVYLIVLYGENKTITRTFLKTNN